MEIKQQIKRKKIDLLDVRVKMEVHEASGVDINEYDFENDVEPKSDNQDTVIGEILYFDEDLYKEITIGTFKLRIIFGTIEDIYSTLLNSSISDLRYEEEIFNIKYDGYDAVQYNVRPAYDNMIPEPIENSFIILDRIEINENYRGNNLLKKVVHSIRRIFYGRILTKPFPLQHEGTGGPNESFNTDLKKVIQTYKKCGFKRARKNSDYFIKW